MLFWVASYPRSGNGFLRTILRDLCGVPTTSVDQAPQLAEAILGPEMRAWLPPAAMHETDGPNRSVYAIPPPKPWSLRPLPEVLADPTPYSLKTHLLKSDGELPAVYLLRDPREVFVSYAHFAPAYGLEISSERFRANVRERILESGGPYGSWSENAEAWLVRPRTCVVRFEDLVLQPLAVLERIIEALQLPRRIDSTRVPRFCELQAEYPHVYRRGQVGGWRDEFPADLLPLVWERHGRVMRRFGFPET